jgi:predicted dehydrogenase
MSKLGIIGCGAVTQQFYVKVLPKIKNIKVTSVYDLDIKVSQKVARLFEADPVPLQNLINNSDYIIIATPPATHYELMLKTLLPGKTVVCEKPFLTKLEDANDIYNQLEKNNAKLYVAHFRRMYPSVEIAKKILETGVLGKISKIDMYEGSRFNWGATSSYFFQNTFGGVLFDTGSHLLDMAMYISGLDLKPIKCKIASVSRNKKEPSHEIKSNFIVYGGEEKITMNLHLSRFQLLANQIQIIAENGSLIIPSYLSDCIKILRGNVGTVIYTPHKYIDNQEAFYHQYINIFHQNNDQIFESIRFKNLTQILESIFYYD